MSTENDERFSFLTAFTKTVCAGLPQGFAKGSTADFTFDDLVVQWDGLSFDKKRKLGFVRLSADQDTAGQINPANLTHHFRISRARENSATALHVLLCRGRQENAHFGHLFSAVSTEESYRTYLAQRRNAGFHLEDPECLLNMVRYLEHAFSDQLPFIFSGITLPNAGERITPSVSKYINQCLHKLEQGIG